MSDVGVAEGDSRLRRGQIVRAVFIGAVGHNKTILVGRKQIGDIRPVRDKVDRTRDMTCVIGRAPVRIQDDDRSTADCGLKFLLGDSGNLSRRTRGDRRQKEKEAWRSE